MQGGNNQTTNYIKESLKKLTAQAKAGNTEALNRLVSLLTACMEAEKSSPQRLKTAA